MRYTLIDGQGNFGSNRRRFRGGLPLQRCRLEKSLGLAADIDMEPSILCPLHCKEREPVTRPPASRPARQRSSGIAVAWRHNPADNLSEVIDACQALLRTRNSR